jgi:hypothetical protein
LKIEFDQNFSSVEYEEEDDGAAYENKIIMKRIEFYQTCHATRKLLLWKGEYRKRRMKIEFDQNKEIL